MFRQEMKDCNDEMDGLRSKLDKLQEEMASEAGIANDLLRDTKANFEQQIMDLEGCKFKTMTEMNELKKEFEATGKQLKKEITLCESLKTKLTTTSESLSQTTNDSRKLNNEHERLLLRADRLETTVTKYETKFEEEIKRRVGYEMEKAKDMKALLAKINQTLQDRNVEIEFLCTKLDNKKQALNVEKTAHEKVKEILLTINKRIER